MPTHFEKACRQLREEVDRAIENREHFNVLTSLSLDMISGKWPNIQDDPESFDATTALGIAARYRQPTLLQALFDDGYFEEIPTGTEEADALVEAAYHAIIGEDENGLECLQVLLENGVSPDSRYNQDSDIVPFEPLICWAAESDAVGCLDALEKAGADLSLRCIESEFMAQNRDERPALEHNALHTAIAGQSPLSLQWCLEHGFDPDSPVEIGTNREKTTPLMMLARDFRDHVESCPEVYEAMLRLLLEYGADLSRTDSQGTSALDHLRPSENLMKIVDEHNTRHDERILLENTLTPDSPSPGNQASGL